MDANGGVVGVLRVAVAVPIGVVVHVLLAVHPVRRSAAINLGFVHDEAHVAAAGEARGAGSEPKTLPEGQLSTPSPTLGTPCAPESGSGLRSGGVGRLIHGLVYRHVLASFANATPSGRRVMCGAGMLLLGACGPEGADGAAPTATLAEFVPTVVEVRWQTAEPSRGKVQFNVVGEAVRETPREPAPTTEHARTLLGLPVDSEVECTVVDEGVPSVNPGG